MSVKNEIDLDFIANEICMDKSYDGIYLILEGDSDELLFSKFVKEESCDIRVADGKENVINLIEMLNNRGKDKVIAIVDKDLDWMNSSTHYSSNVYTTDYHDIEIMCVFSDSFGYVMKEFCSKRKLVNFASIDKLREYIVMLSLPIAHFRIYDKENNLNLSFKPNGKKEKELDYTKFIDKLSFEFLGYEVMIETVKRYYNQAISLNTENIINGIHEICNRELKVENMLHGHDVTNIISIGLKKKIGKSITQNANSEDIERSLRLAYTFSDFSKTQLYQDIITYSNRIGVQIFQ